MWGSIKDRLGIAAMGDDYNYSLAIPAMRLFILAAVLILLIGCVQTAPKGTQVPTPAQQAQAPPPSQLPTHINLSFSREIKGDIMTDQTVFPNVTVTTLNFSNITTPDGKLIVYFFYSARCSACEALMPSMQMLETQYPDVDWLSYDISTQNGTQAYTDFANQHNLSAKMRLVPQVLVNGTIITNRFDINSTLGSLIENFTTS